MSKCQQRQSIDPTILYQALAHACLSANALHHSHVRFLAHLPAFNYRELGDLATKGHQVIAGMEKEIDLEYCARIYT